MSLLLASLLALAVGPALASRLRPDGAGMAALDGFVLVAVSGLVFLHLLPDAVLTGGWWAVGAASLGLVLPGLGEHLLFHAPAEPLPAGAAKDHGVGPQDRLLLALALGGLALHAGLDGAALLAHDVHTAAHADRVAVPTLALGVILHRLPLGLAVWWAAGQGPHRRRAAALLALLGAATVAGFFAGQQGLAQLPLRGLAIFQALVAGALIHVVFQHPPVTAATGRGPTLASAAGGLVGAGSLVGLAWLHGGHDAQGPAPLFLALLLRAAPALLVGLALSAAIRWAWGLRDAHAGSRTPGPPSASHALGAAAAGLLLPARVPACPCHTRAHFRDLLARGAAPVTALAYLLSAPALGVVPWALAWAFGGPGLALAWAVSATAVVSAAALAGAWVARAPATRALAAALHDHPLPGRPAARALASVRPLVGHSLAWALAGAALGAYLGPVVVRAGGGGGLLASAGASWGYVVAAAVLAAPLYMGGAGAAVVAAALLAAGVDTGPVLAALVVVTALHPASLPLVASTLGARAAAAVGLAVVSGAVGAGLLVQWSGVSVMLGWAGGGEGQTLAAVPPHPASGGAALGWVAVAGVAGLLLASLARLGPRGLLAEMFPLSRSQAPPSPR